MSNQTKSWCTTKIVEVAVSELRANLSERLDRALRGEEILVTERGLPVARLLGIDIAGKLERLTG